jgi:hypothetical protein
MFVHPYFSTVRTILACPRNSFGLIETSLHGNIQLVLAHPKSSFGLTETYLHGNMRLVLAYTRSSFRLTETSSHGNILLVLAQPRISFGLTETSLHGIIRLVLARPRSSFGLAESSLLNDYFCNNACTGLRFHFLRANRDIFAWHHTTCLGSPKELITPREGPHHQSLWANRDVFISQHVNSLGPPKESAETTSKIYCSHANWLPVTFTYFQYNSVLLVFDWYYVKVYWRGLAPLVPEMFILQVSGYYSKLLKGPHSHTSNTTPFTGSCKITDGASLP